MKLFSKMICLLPLVLTLPIVAQANRRLSIKSEPSGAKVEIGRVGAGEKPVSIGMTPILSDIADFWFDGPSGADSPYLAEPVLLSVSKEGYETKTELITKGPFEWSSPDGKLKKSYYVLTSADFNVKLEALKSPSGPNASSPQAFIPTPRDTWYKRAPDEINQKAKLKLERALSAKANEADVEPLFAEVVVCGPMLWDALRGEAGKELQESLGVDFVMSIPTKVTKEGRRFLKPEEKRIFWNTFLEKIRGGSGVTVRRATKPEIDYYWSTISFDIEEPLYAVDMGARSVLFQFLTKNGEPKIFWVDIVSA